VIIEATGGLEVPVASALATAGIGIAVVNPCQVREFARATGQLVKTDALDAQVLVRFGGGKTPSARVARRAGPGRSKLSSTAAANCLRCSRRKRTASLTRPR
jgi:transposase